MSAIQRQPAVFFDRDNTLIEDPGYIRDPDQVRLFPDAAPAIVRLRRAGYRIVIVTNQSGIARGLLDEDQLAAVHLRLRELLEQQGAGLDAVYFCPYLDSPAASVAKYRQASHLRKPEPGMLLQAARDLDLDLKRCWMIGNASRDVEAGRRAGCRTILLSRNGTAEDARRDGPDLLVESLLEAAQMVIKTDVSSMSPTEAPADEVDQVADTPSQPDASAPSDDEAVRLLTDIRDLLDRAHRLNRQQDFSLLRLAGTLLQMLAIVAALWGMAALFSTNPVGSTLAIARFALAGVLQLMTLTVSLMDRNR